MDSWPVGLGTMKYCLETANVAGSGQQVSEILDIPRNSEHNSFLSMFPKTELTFKFQEAKQ